MLPEDVDLVLLEFTVNDNANEREKLKLERKQKQSIVHEDKIDQPSRSDVLARLADLTDCSFLLDAWSPQAVLIQQGSSNGLFMESFRLH